MADIVELRVDDKKVLKALETVAKRAKDKTPLMRRIAGIMADGVEENFKQGGRPKWKALAKSTQKKRAKGGTWPGQILQVSGQLAASISSQSDSDSAAVGTNLVYAMIHHFGGTVKHPAGERILYFKTFKKGKHGGRTLFTKATKKNLSGMYGKKVQAKAFFPRVWGWSPLEGLHDSLHAVLPTRVGMVRGKPLSRLSP